MQCFSGYFNWGKMRQFLILGCTACGLAVVFGAFAAHGLKATLSPGALATFQIGVDYQFYHGLALLVVGLSGFHAKTQTLLQVAGLFFTLGIVLFCGSLYGLSVMNWYRLGPVTPVGGLLFILGWGLMATHFLKNSALPPN